MIPFQTLTNLPRAELDADQIQKRKKTTSHDRNKERAEKETARIHKCRLSY